MIIAAKPLVTDGASGERAAQLSYWFERTLCQTQHVHLFKDASKEIADNFQISSLLSDHYIHAQEATAFFRHGMQATLLVIEVPHETATIWMQVAQQEGVTTVLEVLEDWRQKDLDAGWYKPQVLHDLCSRADVITVGADSLRPLLPTHLSGGALLLPNAASEWEFYPDSLRESGQPEVPDVIKATGMKRYVIYFGSLYRTFSWDHILLVAKTCPSTLVVIIGLADAASRKIAEPFQNILLTGQIDQKNRLPYLQHASAALSPLITKNVYDTLPPLNTYEYVFSGKNVISTPNKTIIDAPGVFVAKDMETFAELACDHTLPAPNTSKTIDFILQNSWARRVEMMMASAIERKYISDYAVTVVVLSHNNADIIPTLLGSLDTTVAKRVRDFTVFIGDTNSTDDLENSLHKLRSKYSFDVVSTRISTGGASSGRQRVMDLRYSYFESCTRQRTQPCSDPYRADHLWVFLDSDQFSASSSWLREASILLREHQGKLGALGWAAGWVRKHRFDETVYWLPNRGENDEVNTKGMRIDIDYLGSGGLIVPGNVAREAGGWDSQFDPHGYEDTDFSFAIRSRGYTLGYRRLAGIIHQAHSTTSKISADVDKDMERETLLANHHEKLIKKWGHLNFLWSP